MNGLKYLMTITHREFAEEYIDFMKGIGVPSINVELCKGTATESVINMLGIEPSEKVMLTSALRVSQKDAVKEFLINRLNLTDSGNGISLLVPIDGIGGESGKRYLAGEEPIEKTEENIVENSKYVLIVTIADKGNVEDIMNSARKGGATGGSFVKAHGTGTEVAKFFGISIAEEKEIIYIVAKRDKRDDIMYAVMNTEGFRNKMHGVVFSLPVEGVLGIRDLEEL
jgi:nitrogen regulatory protein PII